MSSKVVVIGGGPAGYTAAFYAADLGMNVTLVEKDKTLGGVCLNVGCIPSKALLHLVALKDEAKSVKAHGLDFGEPKIDLDKIRAFKDSVVQKMTGGLVQLAKMRKVNVVYGTATFKDKNSLEVDTASGKETLAFDHAIIATGSRPVIPAPFALGSDLVMDSTGALALKDIPQKLLVVGGGVIGLEMGSVYAGLGSEVTVVEALPQLATGCDRDLFRPLENRLKTLFKSIYINSKVESMKLNGKKVDVAFTTPEGPKTDSYDRVLLSIGRRPNSENLGLDKIGVTVTDRGFVSVDKQMRTSVANIFAIGDLTGNPMLAHKGSAEGKVAVEVIHGKKSVFDKLGIPGVIYTDPEVAWVGLTETEAKEKNIPHKIGKFPWAASGRATAMGRGEGLTKILFDPETERVLGVGMCGFGAGEMIAEGGLALEMGAVMEDLAGTIHAHPTLSETFMEGAESLHGFATHIYSPKK